METLNSDIMNTEREPKYLSPLLCWDIYSVYFLKLLGQSKANEDLKQLRVVIGRQLESGIIDKIREEEYDALVVTDTLQSIQWVNDGFSEMTGYPKTFAIGKTPHFLQGRKTSEKTKKAIKKGLVGKEYVTQSILNYKKNGEEYVCQIKIIPILDHSNTLTHYLAFEKELKAAS